MILGLSALFAFAASQCTPDLLLDNFPTAKLERCIECGLEPDGTYPLRYFNLVGGDYGAKDSTITVSPSPNGGSMKMVSVWGPADTSEDSTHPGAPTAHNYWYVKFDKDACFNLAKYKTIEFDIVAPAKTDFYIALTQKSADCNSRLIDSVYRNMTNYITPDGTRKTISIPVRDFSTNLLKGAFDLAHLKDLTLVNLTPGASNAIEISNMVLKGDCAASTSTVSAGQPGSATATTGSSSTQSTKSNAADWTAPMYSLLGLVGLLL